MDQGVAAVLGAGVGVLGTLAVAVVTMTATRWQVRTQAVDAHAQWRRQVRRDAYVALLNALGDTRQDLLELSGLIHASQTDSEINLADHWSRVGPGLREVRRLAWVVELEGPQAVRGYARYAGGVINAWTVALFDWEKELSQGRDSSAEGERAHERMAEVSSFIEGLMAAASEVLDGVSRPSP